MKKVRLVFFIIVTVPLFVFLISCAYSQYYPNIGGQWGLYISGPLDDSSSERENYVNPGSRLELPDSILFLSQEALGRLTGTISGAFTGEVSGSITSGGVISMTATKTTADSERTPAVLLKFSGGIHSSNSSQLLGTVTVNYQSGNSESYSWQALKE